MISSQSAIEVTSGSGECECFKPNPRRNMPTVCSACNKKIPAEKQVKIEERPFVPRTTKRKRKK